MVVLAPYDLEGPRPPDLRDRVGLLLEVTRYVEHWQQAFETGTRPSAELISRLNQPVAGLHAQAVAVGFGGLSHHISEFARLLSTGADLSSLRGQLGVVCELSWQARQVLTPEERARYENPAPPNAPLARGAASGQGLAPPPLITIARSLDPAMAKALNEGLPLPPPSPLAPPAPLAGLTAPPAPFAGLAAPPPLVAPAAAHAPRAQPLPPAPPVQQPPAPAAWAPSGPPAAASWSPPAPAPARPAPSPVPAAPQFGVKSMLGLRAFNKSGGAPNGRSTPAPAGKAGVLGLPGFGSSPDLRGPSKPPLVGPDGSGLPALAPEAARARASGSGSRSGPQPTSELLQQLRSDRRSDRPPRRSAAPPKGDPRRAVVRGRIRGASGGSAGIWLGIAGATVLLGIGLVAYFTLGRHPASSAAKPGESGTVALTAPSDSSSTPAANHDPALPRERLLADNERFTALLAQVHGHGGKESPELRSLLNDQAAFASKALSGKCNDGSLTCKAWGEVRELMVGNRNQAIVKRRRGSDTESTRSRWMAGLKMPAIPVEDDPRVARVFEFYTQNPVGRETFQSMLFRCGAYRDLIQSTLIRYDMPPDLMALAFTESGCEPSAKSPVGAAGLWQFMPETARAYHLRVIEGTIDERYSPFKSTEASIRMLADLRQKLGSWDLVFASYNLGPFGVLARVERAGGDATFWDLVDAGLLPDETANYSPTVEAIALILANLQRLKFTGLQIRSPQLTADLEVPGGTRLGLVARAAATSVTQLRSLNLDFSGDVVPLIPGGSIAVQVNKDVVWQARDSIKELLASKDGADQCVPPNFDWGKQRFTPDMNAACQRRLSAGLGAANSAAP